jgi:hypothetical protein
VNEGNLRAVSSGNRDCVIERSPGRNREVCSDYDMVDANLLFLSTISSTPQPVFILSGWEADL